MGGIRTPSRVPQKCTVDKGIGAPRDAVPRQDRSGIEPVDEFSWIRTWYNWVIELKTSIVLDNPMS